MCGKWFYTGPKDPLGELGDKPGPDDCAACWRKAKATYSAESPEETE